MNDISGFGLTINIVASNTFPQGFQVTQFADDADPFDSPSQVNGTTTMGLNGDLIFASAAAPINPTINVIPDSEDDRNLQILLEANRVGKGKTSARDIITMTVAYPSGSTVTFSQGKIISGIPFNSVASAGRLKSKPYAFSFENRTGTAAS